MNTQEILECMKRDGLIEAGIKYSAVQHYDNVAMLITISTGQVIDSYTLCKVIAELNSSAELYT